MKLEEYLIPGILENKWKEYKSEIEEFFNLHNSDFIYGQRRDNCGVVAAAFCTFMQNKGFIFQRIEGEFVNNKGVYGKLDFYKEELNRMPFYNLKPNLLDDRKKFAKISNLEDRQKTIPHYWNVDEKGLIVDLSGYSQFVKTELSPDLNIERYIPKNKNIKTLKFI